MREITKKLYVCEYCETVHETAEQATQCEERYHEWQLLENIPIWRWYELRHRISGATQLVFVYGKDKVSTDACCLHREVQLLCTHTHEHMAINDTWQFVRALSLEEAYDRQHLIPVLILPLTAIPNEIRARIVEIYDKYNKELRKHLEGLAHEELVHELYALRCQYL